MIGTAVDRSGVDPDHGQPVVMLEANVDDVTGEILGATVAALMRGGRPRRLGHAGHRQEGAARPTWSACWATRPSVGRLRQVLADETGTLGIRAQSWQRWPAERQFAEVEVGGYPVRVKRGPRRIKAEHDDAARVAALLRLPVREVARRAEEAAHRLFDGGARDGDPSATEGPGDARGRPRRRRAR